ncbi:hypothetical protein EHS17_03115 [Rhodobacteraceae bacterium CH30]|nr:hypothetical protein EHS17_03115 [Rhodobacteraceae bacterium CH30]
MFSLRTLLLRQTLLIAAVILAGALLVVQQSVHLNEAEATNRQTSAAIAAFKDVRFHVVQIQQFLTDASAVGVAEFNDARQHRDSAKALLQQLGQQQTELASEIHAASALIDPLYNTGERMAHAYIGSGREAGNAIMKQPETGFDAAAARLAGTLDQLASRLDAKVAADAAQADASMRDLIYTSCAVSLLALLLLLGGNIRLGKRLFSIMGGEPALAQQLVRAVANGRLQTHENPRGDSVLGSLDQMVRQLAQHLRNIHQASQQIAVSSYQISEISGDIVSVNRTQSEQAQEVSEASNAVQTAVSEVKLLSDQAIAQVEETRRRALDGLKAVQNSQSEMGTIGERTQEAEDKVRALMQAGEEIGNIVDVIRHITEQTNILSLNAAIEAARAGESGRGFAVVADEVRNLAQRTASATNDIMAIIQRFSTLLAESGHAINAIASSTQSGLAQSANTLATIDAIAQSAEDTRQVARQIHHVVDQQNECVLRQQMRLSGLYDTLEQSTARVHTTGLISHDLYEVTQKLRDLLASFEFEREQEALLPVNEQRTKPRADNNLLVKLSHHQQQLECISTDLSLCGMKLRLPEPLTQPDGDVQLEIMTPFANLEDYRNQQPLRLKGKIVWQKDVAGQTMLALNYAAQLSANEKTRLESCFAFLGKAAHFGTPTSSARRDGKTEPAISRPQLALSPSPAAR